MSHYPHWWTPADAAHVEAMHAWEADSRRPFPHGSACRTCFWWNSADGEQGCCTIPETPSTVNCGETDRASLCEQYHARVACPPLPDDLAAYGFVPAWPAYPHWLRWRNVVITGADVAEVHERAYGLMAAAEARRTAQAAPKQARRGKTPAHARIAAQEAVQTAEAQQLGLL